MIRLAPSGIPDGTARLYAEPLCRLTGQRVIVENRTGAGSGVAAAAVQNAPPDVYTLLAFSGVEHATVAVRAQCLPLTYSRCTCVMWPALK